MTNHLITRCSTSVRRFLVHPAPAAAARPAGDDVWSRIMRGEGVEIGSARP